MLPLQSLGKVINDTILLNNCNFEDRVETKSVANGVKYALISLYYDESLWFKVSLNLLS